MRRCVLWELKTIQESSTVTLKQNRTNLYSYYLARDPIAPVLVNLWAQLKVLESGYLSEKTSEAVDTALAMQIYKLQLKNRCDICHNTPPPGYHCPACGHILD